MKKELLLIIFFLPEKRLKSAG